MKPAQRFEDLMVWQKSHQLVLRVYRLTSEFPKREIYGLAAQMRRAAASVPANIAEGFKRQTRSDKARLMNVAQASLEELRYYFILTSDLGYATSSERIDSDELARMLHAYTASLRSHQVWRSRDDLPASCFLSPPSGLRPPVSCLLSPVS